LNATILQATCAGHFAHLDTPKSSGSRGGTFRVFWCTTVSFTILDVDNVFLPLAFIATIRALGPAVLFSVMVIFIGITTFPFNAISE